jgi:alanyl-tRNA synthetase
MKQSISGNKIRSDFISFFEDRGHTFVPSSSLVPGGDQTLLFTNAGMVQFKDVFLGTDKRPYTRAANSQKCMRVSGKHNDLDDVGRDNTHHTFFEMLGNWSFGDYYKKEAITWAWELLTDVWKIEKSNLWVTCFKDEKEEIPTDEEAFLNWKDQPGMIQDHILFFGRKDNFWEMADTGPCGPCSEIHIDRGESFCDKQGVPGHTCQVNGDCARFLELWNLVFIQYNRTGPSDLSPLPATHVDTGMGFERIVSVLQDVDSNYKTDQLLPMMDVVMELSKQTSEERESNITPYRVIADHCRAASFLIADGVVPGNIGRNYICRMIIRRASRFGTKLGLNDPFLAKVAESVIEIYGDAYPELVKNSKTILDSLTREEKKFQSTVEGGLAILENLIEELGKNGINELDGRKAFDLYATHGLPLEITKDVLGERGLQVDQSGFFSAMDTHRINSGAGKEFGELGGEDAEFYARIASNLIAQKKISPDGVSQDPYGEQEIQTEIVAIIKDGDEVSSIGEGEIGEIVLMQTNFYIESGGQVSDVGQISTENYKNLFMISEIRKPASGIIVHTGEVEQGEFTVGTKVKISFDFKRRQDIRRNHTATHLLQFQLREMLGEHVRQAGSLVAPDRLRFDFTHPDGLKKDQIRLIEDKINERVLENSPVMVSHKKLSEALSEGATALFGEKYGEDVRTISIGRDNPYSYELCGGTHVSETGEIGTFLITSEGSAAAGIRRIEAVTGRGAYALIRQRLNTVDSIASLLESSPNQAEEMVKSLLQQKNSLLDDLNRYNEKQAVTTYTLEKQKIENSDQPVALSLFFEDIPMNILRQLADQFRNDFPQGIALFGSLIEDEKVQFVVVASDPLVEKGIHAGNIAREIAEEIGGSGGGRPNMAQAGGSDFEKLKTIKIKDYLENIS